MELRRGVGFACERALGFYGLRAQAGRGLPLMSADRWMSGRRFCDAVIAGFDPKQSFTMHRRNNKQ